jgi:hypothetical protein
MRATRLILLAIAMLAPPALIAAAPTAGAAAERARPIAAGKSLSAHSPVLTFRGRFTNPTPLPVVSDPLPTGCAVNCDQWTLKSRTRRPFLVSIKNHNGSTNDGLNLFVSDPSGRQVASADGIGANGQAVVVPHPVRGTYTVQVTVTYAYDQVTAYRGEARVMAGRSCRQTSSAKKRCP